MSSKIRRTLLIKLLPYLNGAWHYALLTDTTLLHEEGGRDLIYITKFDGKEETMVSSRIGQKLQKSPHLVHPVHALVLLFGESEETETKQTFASNKELHLPKLFAPFKDKRRGWHIGTVREQAIEASSQLRPTTPSSSTDETWIATQKFVAF